MTPQCSYPGCKNEPAPKHTHLCGEHCDCVTCGLTRLYDYEYLKFTKAQAEAEEQARR